MCPGRAVLGAHAVEKRRKSTFDETRNERRAGRFGLMRPYHVESGAASRESGRADGARHLASGDRFPTSLMATS